MTPEEFAEEIKACVSYDIEIGHGAADVIMCELLRSLGYGDGVDLFEEMDKWYA